VDDAEVITENVIQVRVQAVGDPKRGIFKVVRESDMDKWFSGPDWLGTSEVQTTMVDNLFQVISHHKVMTNGMVEAWWVTVHPAF
jgi:hypothetical protein